jgi:hypothetical protein
MTMQAEPGRPGPIECLQRGLRSLRANWALVPILLLQSLLTLALTLAGAVVLMQGLGIRVVAWLSGIATVSPQRIADELVAGLEAPLPPLASLMLPLLVASLLWTVAFVLYCYLQGGIVGVLASGESAAGAGLPGWRSFCSFSATMFDRHGRRLFWRYFWLNHLIAGVGLIWMLLLLGLSLLALLFAADADLSLGMALGCVGLVPLGMLFLAVALWAMLATVEAAHPAIGIWRASGRALVELRRGFLPVTILWLLAMVASMAVSGFFAPLRLGAAFALRQYQVISLGARGALLLGESLLACAVIVTLVAALAAHLGLRREGAAGVAC